LWRAEQDDENLAALDSGHRRAKHSVDEKTQDDLRNSANFRATTMKFLSQMEQVVQAQEQGYHESQTELLRILVDQLRFGIESTEASFNNLCSVLLPSSPDSSIRQ
jgi:hypothetical protein